MVDVVVVSVELRGLGDVAAVLVVSTQEITASVSSAPSNL